MSSGAERFLIAVFWAGGTFCMLFAVAWAVIAKMGMTSTIGTVQQTVDALAKAEVELLNKQQPFALFTESHLPSSINVTIPPDAKFVYEAFTDDHGYLVLRAHTRPDAMKQFPWFATPPGLYEYAMDGNSNVKRQEWFGFPSSKHTLF